MRTAERSLAQRDIAQLARSRVHPLLGEMSRRSRHLAEKRARRRAPQVLDPVKREGRVVGQTEARQRPSGRTRTNRPRVGQGQAVPPLEAGARSWSAELFVAGCGRLSKKPPLGRRNNAGLARTRARPPLGEMSRRSRPRDLTSRRSRHFSEKGELFSSSQRGSGTARSTAVRR